MKNGRIKLMKAIMTTVTAALMLMTVSASASTGISKVDDFAGTGNSGQIDGAAGISEFRLPYGLALDKDYGIIVVDSNNNKIRKILDGQVTTIAGYSQKNDQYEFPEGGYTDGELLKSSFNGPRYAAVDSKGIIYVTDTGNNVIRKLMKGKVYTFSGDGKAGYADGIYSKAKFNGPSGIAIDKNDNVYIADSLNNVIRKITPEGTVSTYAGKQSDTGGYKDGELIQAEFNEPSGLAFDKNGVLYVLDSGNQVIRKISNSKVTSYAGLAGEKIEGTSYFQGGLRDGYGKNARFNFPKGITVSDNGIIFIADTWNNSIRAIKPDGKVVTIAGTSASGNYSGEAKDARFNGPAGILYHDGKLYISDMWNNEIRVMDVGTGDVKQLAGENNPIEGMKIVKSNKFQLYFCGKAYSLEKSQIITSDNGVQISLTAFCKIWGGSLNYDSKNRAVVLTKGKLRYTLDVSKDNLTVSGGQIYADLRTLSAKLGYFNYWAKDFNAFVLK